MQAELEVLVLKLDATSEPTTVEDSPEAEKIGNDARSFFSVASCSDFGCVSVSGCKKMTCFSMGIFSDMVVPFIFVCSRSPRRPE